MSLSVEAIRQPVLPVQNGSTARTPRDAGPNAGKADSAVVYQPAPPHNTEPTTYTAPRAPQPVGAGSEARLLHTPQPVLVTFTAPQDAPTLVSDAGGAHRVICEVSEAN